MGELQFDTYYADPLSANVMTAIADNWKTNLGLTVKPLPLENVAWQKLYYEDGNSDISFWGAANGPTGDRGYNYFHSSAAYPTGSNGVKGHSYNNPEVDKLLEDARVEFDQAKQDAIYQQVCRDHEGRPAESVPLAVRPLPRGQQEGAERHRDPRRRRWLVLRCRRVVDRHRVT